MPYITSIERSGIERGHKEGRKEGARETGQRNLKRVLARRFGELGEDLRMRLERIESSEELERLVEEAAVASSLEVFVGLLPPADS